MIDSKEKVPVHYFVSKTRKAKYGQCIRKEGHSLKIAEKIIKRKAQQGIFLRVYLCKYCQMWHLTHLSKK